MDFIGKTLLLGGKVFADSVYTNPFPQRHSGWIVRCGECLNARGI